MSHKPLDQARNADLRGSWAAIQRAAQQALASVEAYFLSDMHHQPEGL